MHDPAAPPPDAPTLADLLQPKPPPPSFHYDVGHHLVKRPPGRAGRAFTFDLPAGATILGAELRGPWLHVDYVRALPPTMTKYVDRYAGRLVKATTPGQQRPEPVVLGEPLATAFAVGGAEYLLLGAPDEVDTSEPMAPTPAEAAESHEQPLDPAVNGASEGGA